MSMQTRGRSRLAALATAGALAASTLVLTAPAAQAAPAPGQAALAWSISEQYVDHLSTRVLADGATFDEAAKRFTFPADGVASAGGATTYSYDGSVRGAFGFGGTELYAVTIADPQVTVAPGGAGSITAVVSASNAAAQGNPAGSTSPARVTVADFTGGVATPAGVAATPAWADVLPAGSATATELGITTADKPNNPVGGQSFHPDFLAQLTSGVRAHFYASGSGSDAKKKVGSVAAAQRAAAAPSVTATVTAASPANGVDLRIAGTGFTPRTNPSDDGVYVGVAPAGAKIDFDDRDGGTAAMVAVDWVSASQMSDGSFVRGLNLPKSKLAKGTSYAVYTWQAHTHSNTTQDTVTPISINWAAVFPAKVAPKLTVKVAKAPTTRKAGKAVVTVKGARGKAAGKVKAKILKGKKAVKSVKAVKLRKGKATLKLPKLAKGSYQLKVTYLGSASYQNGAKTKAVKVRKR
ncbi:Ig-like domain repeat protein [Nocardioides pantholopis]|uniref:Ig-like domain repeat protein n=1 Tax=Nocardioides pantholopis TaxID=2483798 RepID=UPI000FD97B32|nr:hypothetical protein [Nocardioides pantholopis]